MLLYIAVYFIIIIFAGLDAAFNKGRNHIIRCFLVYLSFIVLVFFRSFVDIDSLPDLRPYYDIWNEVGVYDWNHFFNVLSWGWSSVERGYLLLTKVNSSLYDDFAFHLTVCSIISIGCFTGTMFKYSKYFWASMLVYFPLIFPMSSYVLRQYLAMSVLLLSIPFVVKRKIIPFLLILLLAYYLHSTALLFTPVFFLYGIKKKRNLLLISLSIIMVISVLLPILGDSLMGMGDTFEYYSNTYINAEKYSKGAKLTSFFISSVYLFFYLFFLRENAFKDGINRLILICLLLSTVMSFMLTGVGLMFRIVAYFQMMYILAISKTMEYIKDRSIRIMFCVVVLSLNFIREFVMNSDSDVFGLKMDFNNMSIVFIILIMVSGSFIFKLYYKENLK